MLPHRRSHRGDRVPARRPSRRLGPPGRRPWALEALEGRTLLTLYTVNVATDSAVETGGAGTGTVGDLRYVLNQANAETAHEIIEIRFDPALAGTTISYTGPVNLTRTDALYDIVGPSGERLTLDNSTATDVLYVASGVTANITGLGFSGGELGHGSGIHNEGYLSIYSCRVSGNVNDSGGAGILNLGRMGIEDSTIANNGAYGLGGGILNRAGGILTMGESVIDANQGGTGIANLGGAIDLTNVTISNNSWFGILNSGGGSAFIGSCTITGNYQEGIRNEPDSSLCTIIGCTIEANSHYGITNGGAMSVTRSTIDGNKQGGIINFGLDYNDATGSNTNSLAIVDSTVASNPGCGVFQTGDGPVLVTNSTIAYNENSGLFVANYSRGVVTLNNTIVALNTAPLGAGNPAPRNISGLVSPTSAYNMIGIGNPDGSGGLTDGINHNLVNVFNTLALGLGPLADNGGSTRTIGLLPGSLAINGGSNDLAVDADGSPLLLDQRAGILGNRVVGGIVDIGAFEFDWVITRTNLAVTPTTTVLGQPVTMTAYVYNEWSIASPPTGAVQFFDGDTLLGAAPLALIEGESTATLITGSVPVGIHSLRATYVPDNPSYLPSSSTGLDSLTVRPTPTSVALSVPPGDPVEGLPVTFTATVTTPFGLKPTGTVTFYDEATPLGTATLTDSGGVETATLAAPAPAAGAHRVWAVYNPDDANVYGRSSSMNGRTTVVAGTGEAGHAGDGHDATAAQLWSPLGLALDGAGNLYVADPTNNDVRKITPDGIITTLVAGFDDLQTAFPKSLAVDGAGNVFIGFTDEVVKVAPDGARSIVFSLGSGNGVAATVPWLTDGRFAQGYCGIAADAAGNLFVAVNGVNDRRDPENPIPHTNAIVQVAPDGSASVTFLSETETNGGFAGDLAIDAAGHLLVKFGGLVAQVQPDGSLTEFCQLRAFPMTDLAVDAAGALFAGYSSEVSEGQVGGASAPFLCSLGGGIIIASNLILPSPRFDGAVVDASGNLYVSDTSDHRVLRVDRTPNLNVRPLTSEDVQSVLNDAASGGSATIQPTSDAVVSTAVAAINSLSSPPAGTTETVTLDLGGGTFTTDTHIQAPDGVTVIIANGTLVGGSPALIVDSGDVLLDGVTALNATNAPTILVSGGSLRVRGSTIQESTGYAQAAIRIDGGTVDLGTAADPGGNTFNVNGTGELIHNASPSAVPAVGNMFQVNGATLAPGFALENAIYDCLDDPRAGGVAVDTSGSVYVTAASGSVQRGVDAASPGATIYVQSGVKGAFTVGAKPLTIAFQDGTTLALLADPVYPGNTTLVVTGTSGGDNLLFNPGNAPGDVAVAVNQFPTGAFHPTGRIVAHGEAGDDDIQVAGGITLPAWLYGDEGNDRLKGGAGNNVILGGAGDDLLVGGSNRDLLIGGTGADRIVGNEADDILISGRTAYDADDAAIAAVLAEWTSARNYATRVANLRGTGTGPRSNGTTFLVTEGPGATVLDDGVVDVLTGDTGLDWFLFNADGDGDPTKKDKVTDLSAQEFASDIDFITGP